MACAKEEKEKSIQIVKTQNIMTGTCKWFDEKKGFGFITCDDGSIDAYVHCRNIYNIRGYEYLQENEKVEFKVRISGRGKTAVNLTGPAGVPVKGLPKSRETGLYEPIQELKELIMSLDASEAVRAKIVKIERTTKWTMLKKKLYEMHQLYKNALSQNDDDAKEMEQVQGVSDDTTVNQLMKRIRNMVKQIKSHDESGERMKEVHRLHNKWSDTMGKERVQALKVLHEELAVSAEEEQEKSIPIVKTQNVMTGTCKWFNEKKGFGYITCDDGSGDVFVHHSNISNVPRHQYLQKDEKVEFEIKLKGDKKTAVNVTGPGGVPVKGVLQGFQIDKRQNVMTGTCLSFNEMKGFGFIKCDDGSINAYVHCSNIYNGNGYEYLQQGEKVEFEVRYIGSKKEAFNVTGPGSVPVRGVPKSKTALNERIQELKEKIGSLDASEAVSAKIKKIARTTKRKMLKSKLHQLQELYKNALSQNDDDEKEMEQEQGVSGDKTEYQLKKRIQNMIKRIESHDESGERMKEVIRLDAKWEIKMRDERLQALKVLRKELLCDLELYAGVRFI